MGLPRDAGFLLTPFAFVCIFGLLVKGTFLVHDDFNYLIFLLISRARLTDRERKTGRRVNEGRVRKRGKSEIGLKKIHTLFFSRFIHEIILGIVVVVVVR